MGTVRGEKPLLLQENAVSASAPPYRRAASEDKRRAQESSTHRVSGEPHSNPRSNPFG
jgi:hypothetical protein